MNKKKHLLLTNEHLSKHFNSNFELALKCIDLARGRIKEQKDVNINTILQDGIKGLIPQIDEDDSCP